MLFRFRWNDPYRSGSLLLLLLLLLLGSGSIVGVLLFWFTFLLESPLFLFFALSLQSDFFPIIVTAAAALFTVIDFGVGCFSNIRRVRTPFGIPGKKLIQPDMHRHYELFLTAVSLF